MMNKIDLRSDTVTQPTPAMRAAMMAASVGDDVFEDDPSIHHLQNQIAEWTGKEAALFFPSGTQSNLAALLSHCQRGDEYIVGQKAHTYRYEGGGAAVLGGIQPQPLEMDDQGQMNLDHLSAAIKPHDIHFARTRLIALENTWNGHVLTHHYVEQVAAIAQQNQLKLHLDGARLWNAVVARMTPTPTPTPPTQQLQTQLKKLVAPFDSASLCFSKGLGCPIGSVLVGQAEWIQTAKRWRKVLGGGMRQSGLLAAACSYALEHHWLDLHHDHQKAQRLADGLAQIKTMKVLSCATNIVFAQPTVSSQTPALLAWLKQHGILATGLIGMRFVTHRAITEADIDQTLDCIQAFFDA